jgi:molecular chaperone DnaK (HSP70)
MVRFSYGLLALLLAGCARTESASLVVEAPSEAISPDGTLREPVGIGTLGGVLTPLLAKGCKLPCATSQTFSTAENGQGQILLHLYRGEAVLSKSAHSLGTFQISGIAPMARGEPSILVEFKADQGGITLTATDRQGKSRVSLTRVAP